MWDTYPTTCREATTSTGNGLPREAYCSCKGAQAFPEPCDSITAVPCVLPSSMAAGHCPSITTPHVVPLGLSRWELHHLWGYCTWKRNLPTHANIHTAAFHSVDKRDQQSSLQVLQHRLARARLQPCRHNPTRPTKEPQPLQCNKHGMRSAAPSFIHAVSCDAPDGTSTECCTAHM